MSERLCAIVNPRAGGWKRLQESNAQGDPSGAVARWLAPDAQERVTVHMMRGPGDGAHWAGVACAEGCRTIVAVGGDGTLNDILQGLMPASDTARLGLIPMGTANVLARVLGIPRHDPVTAGRIVAAGRERRIDLGRAGTQWFALVAGVGFDGAVTQAVNLRLKRYVGKLAYAMAAAQVAWTYPHYPLRIRLDHGEAQEFRAYLVLIANGERYAGPYHLGPGVQIDDGLLDIFVCLRQRPLMFSLATHGLALAFDRFQSASHVHHFRARHVALDADGPLPVELDGDLAGATPLTIEIAPAALRVLSPPTEPERRNRY